MNQPQTTSQQLAMRPAQAGGHIASQATQIEQSRAIAQVQGALVVAQQRPRDTILALSRMQEACDNYRLAERAFFRFKRGGQQVSGESIHLAVELARCWGNIDYGISELRRDDVAHESEMMAYAWDLETNARSQMTFIVPHKRDTQGGAKMLTDMRDIYENNANMGARRVRECIFRVLPRSYVDEAAEICANRLEKGAEGLALPERREKMLEAFHSIGVSREQIERKTGQSAGNLGAFMLGQLAVVFSSIKRGEVAVADEFPTVDGGSAGQTTAAALAQAPQQPKAPAEQSVEPSAAAQPEQSAPDAPAAAGEDDGLFPGDQPTDKPATQKAAAKPDKPAAAAQQPSPQDSPQDSPMHVKIPVDEATGAADYGAYAMALCAVFSTGGKDAAGRAEFLRANPALERLAFAKDVPETERTIIAGIRADAKKESAQ
ncbi:MAG: hypothetical protein ACMVO3_22910 [Thalassobaculum sp.]